MVVAQVARPAAHTAQAVATTITGTACRSRVFVGDTCVDGIGTGAASTTNPGGRRPDGGGSGANPSAGRTAAPASTDNTAKSDCQNPTTANPVILATGQKIKSETDIVANGDHGMGLTRTYRSRAGGGMFGNGWLSTYDHVKLYATGCARHTDYPNRCLPTSVKLTLPDGTTYTYTSPALYNFTYKVSSSAALGTMTYDPVGGYIVRLNTRVYNYSSAGLIQSVTSRGGYTLLSYSYASNPYYPSRVTNGAGRHIDFTYDANFVVTKATDAAGNAWTYQYQNANLLKSVTSPGVSPDVRTYFYEAATIEPNLLTGIAINGVRYSTYKYYADKRVQ
jgi:YD repeat-containing protein